MTGGTAASARSGSRSTLWKGTERYEILRIVGEGGMGIVYEANDRERRQSVALKLLQNFSPEALYLFKQEFRTLADVRHRNLVRLHELAVDGDEVFFTMELVLGTDFLSYVRSNVVTPGRGSSEHPTLHINHPDGRRDDARSRPQPTGPISAPDLDRLRPTLRQLVESIQALHAAGKVHRDIKPSNVLVTNDGRVVLLDFGVATELSLAAQSEASEGPRIVGTVAYMAPEQAGGDLLSTASDWYSVGVMLYEALAGRPPFEGPMGDVITLKCIVDPPPPSSFAAEVPEDLDLLCRELLHIDPDKRPAGPEILRRLAAASPSLPTILSKVPRTQAENVFVGREAEIEALRDAFETACTGRAVTVRVSGAAGMGKSTLVQHFVDGLTSSGEVVVLRGRAYERESVPYKAIDSVVDALSRHLMRLEDNGDAVALPEDVWALACLFPVLRRVPVVAGSAAPPVIDPQGIRLRAFGALRELLKTLRRRKPLVVYIDDVHWGDTDSAGLLVELMGAYEPPPILLIMTHRPTDDEASPFLAEITEHWPEAADVRKIVVHPLEPEAAQRLAFRLIESAGAPSVRAARAIAREGGGSPFLIEELARHGGRAAADNPPTFSVLTLQQMVAERMERLADEPRHVLELLAVAGRPLPVPVLADASGVYAAADELVATLAAQRFVRNGLRGGQEVVELVHERIRETVVAALPEQRLREHHGRLACVLQTTPSPDAEAVAMHLLGAGDPRHLPRFAERAAEDAADKLAFEQAARLFRLILRTLPAASPDARRLRTRLAQVLEWSGHGAEAARVYLEAAERAKGMQRVGLERAAAEQLLTSGHLDEGREVLLRVLAAVGVTAPHTPNAAALWILFYRLWMALFGVRLGDRDQEEIRPEDRMRVDALYAVSIGFATVDVVLAACMQARHLILALRVGDRLQELRAVITMTTQLANRGGPPGKQERALLEIVREALGRTDSPEAHAYATGNHGVALFLRGHWREAAQVSDAAYVRYPNIRGGWHSNAKLFALYALAYTGDLPELARRYERLLAEATHRGDLYMAVNLCTSTAKVIHLAADDPEKARCDLREAVAQWSKLGYLLQHWQALRSEVDIDIYAGDGASAYDRVQRDTRPLRRSFLLQSQFVRVMTLDLRGRAAIASIAQCPSFRAARLAEARRMVRRLELERMPYADGLASLLAGAVACAAHDRVAATAALRTAIDRLEGVHMAHFAASARYRLGQLLGDDGGTLVRDAEEALAVRGVREIHRFSAIYLPGSDPS